LIIGVKYWALGASAPGSWTDLQVAECESDVINEPFDEGIAPLSGTRFRYDRNYVWVRIVIDPVSFNHGTYGPVATSLRQAYRIRIKDPRYSWLEDGDTVDLVRQGSNQATRTEPSLYTRSLELSFISVDKV